MTRSLTSAQCKARYEALAEAAEHLRVNWSVDPVELREGHEMSHWLDKKADAWLQEAERRETGAAS